MKTKIIFFKNRYKLQILPEMERKLAIILKENERLNTLLSNQGSLSGADAQKITALEGKLFCTTSELEKLNKLLNDKHLENESLIKKLGESESKAKRIIELENSLLLLTNENQKLWRFLFIL